MSEMLERQAEQVLGHEYDSFRGTVTGSALAGLSAAKIETSRTDLAAFYNQAWYGVYSRLNSGEPVGVHEELLSEIAQRRATDEFRTAHPDRRLDPAVLEAVGIADPIAETIDQQRELNEFSERLRENLNSWELQAATLNYVFGFTLPEAAHKVGVSPGRMAPVMDVVLKGLGEALAPIEEAQPCAERLALINQFAFGVFGPRSDEFVGAVEHLKGCPGCRRHVLGARALTAVTISSRAVVVALTGAGVAAGAPRAASPVAKAPPVERRATPAPVPYRRPSRGGRRKAAIAAALAVLMVGGFALSHRDSGNDVSQVNTAQTDSQAAAAERAKAEAAKAKAATAKRKARAAKKHRAEKRRAVKRRHARERAAAARRRAAATQNAAATTPAQVQQPVQSVPQQQPASNPAPKSQPAPSTDPSQEFKVK